MPAGAGTASKFTSATRNASLATFSQCDLSSSGLTLDLPPPPAVPVSLRPSFSTIMEMFNLVIGRTSLTEKPSGLKISISW